MSSALIARYLANRKGDKQQPRGQRRPARRQRRPQPSAQRPPPRNSGDLEQVNRHLIQTRSLLEDGGKSVWVKWLGKNGFSDAAKSMEAVNFSDASKI